MPPLLLITSTGRGEPAWNMALDEALLLRAAPRALPLLRFYGWTLPAATFGYSQHYADIARLTLLRPLIRRPTGGGLVPHDRDWTYSLAVPPDHPWCHLPALESYRTMHRWIVEAFTRLGIATELAPERRHDGPGQCFVGYEKCDVLGGGRKVAGAAQRRNRHGLLIQGSLQPPVGALRAAWEEAMRQTAPPSLIGGVRDHAPDPGDLTLAEELAASRYRQAAYNEQR